MKLAKNWTAFYVRVRKLTDLFVVDHQRVVRMRENVPTEGRKEGTECGLCFWVGCCLHFLMLSCLLVVDRMQLFLFLGECQSLYTTVLVSVLYYVTHCCLVLLAGTWEITLENK